MKTKLNLHAHSIYSDGSASVSAMANAYKIRGFSVCIITDHVYQGEHDYSLNVSKFENQLKDAKESSDFIDIPVIIGAEFSVNRQEECLVFGVDAIRYLLKIREERLNDESPSIIMVTIDDLKYVRENFDCAVVLCHPCLAKDTSPNFIESGGHKVIDAYEYINSGQVLFKRREIPEEFKNIKQVCNSDAHALRGLDFCWMYVDSSVTNEKELIDLIKSDKEFELVIGVR